LVPVFNLFPLGAVALITVGALDTPGSAEDVALVGDLAYVADGSSGLRVIDISNPALPVEIGALDTPGQAIDVEVVGDLAYLADGDSGLRVMDVSNPALPVELGALDTPGYAYDVEVVGDLAYVANRRFELRVIDVSNPALPVEIGNFDTPGPTYDVEVVGGLTYVAADHNGLRIIDFGPEYRSGIAVDIDIKPGSCPNSWNRESNGVLPVAILGTEDFDVTQIDVASVTISRADGMGGSVGPNEGPPGPHSVFEDVGTPFEGEVCGCHEAEGDGILDLSLKFKTRDVADLLPVDDPNGALVPLIVTGTLLDGAPFASSSDCVRLVPPGSPPNQVTVQSIAGGWVDATPLDNNLDGGGFGSFQRTYPHTTVLTLTAPSSHDGNPFVGWRLDEGELIQGRSLALVVNNAEHTARAVFKKANGCGLGLELVLLVPPLMWLYGRRRRTRA
jgi:hypothetical protein